METIPMNFDFENPKKEQKINKKKITKQMIAHSLEVSLLAQNS